MWWASRQLFEHSVELVLDAVKSGVDRSSRLSMTWRCARCASNSAYNDLNCVASISATSRMLHLALNVVEPTADVVETEFTCRHRDHRTMRLRPRLSAPENRGITKRLVSAPPVAGARQTGSARRHSDRRWPRRLNPTVASARGYIPGAPWSPVQ